MADTWQQVLGVLQSRLDPTQFETWMSPIRPADGPDGTLTLEVPDEFFARWVRDNYLDLIKDAIWDTSRRHLGVHLKVATAEPTRSPDPRHRPDPAAGDPPAPIGERLVPWFTFETFVVGPSNEVAHSACEMVAQKPAQVYNPLFIYGGVGLGKTHLLQSVGHAVLAASPGFRVLYMSGETYVNEVMTAFKNDRLDSLRHRYRGQCDVLLVDDIQYLAGKEFAQDEFFHTFNELYNAQKQIVITGDQFPSAIPKFSERLRSRFGWGLIVDIAPPEAELRRNILRRKAVREGLEVPEDVIAFLADRFPSSIRDLEGALNRVSAHALIRKVPLSLELARQVIDRFVTDRRGRLSADLVLKTVADYFGLHLSDLKSRRRHRAVSLPRQVAAFLLRRHTGIPLQAIGQSLGGRGHSTILVSLSRIESLLGSDPTVERAVKDIERQLGV